MEVLLGGGGIVGLLVLWKFVEKIVDARMSKRNSKGNNPGKPILCPYENSVALKNSLNNIDTKLGIVVTKLTSIDESQKRVERKLNV